MFTYKPKNIIINQYSLINGGKPRNKKLLFFIIISELCFSKNREVVYNFQEKIT